MNIKTTFTLLIIFCICTLAHSSSADEKSGFNADYLQKITLQRYKLEMQGRVAETVLKNESSTREARAYAALIIGQLKRVSAIPVLIKHIDLPGASDFSFEDDIGNDYPCVRALTDMGIASMPALVMAYSTETNTKRKELIQMALIFCKAYPETHIYIEGLRATTKDVKVKRAMIELKKKIPLDNND